METSTTAQANTFGITSSTLLDTSYLDSLFSGDPEQVTQIEDTPAPDKTPSPASTGLQQKKTEEKKPATAESTSIEDAGFLDKLDELEPGEKGDGQETTDIPTSSSETSPLPEKETTQAGKTDYLAANITAFGKELYDIGFLTAEDEQAPEPIANTEQLVDRMNKEKKKGAIQVLENILSNFGPEYRQAFDAIYLDGVHPRDYFGQADQVTSLQELDLGNIENQRHVLRTHYRSLGWDAAKISAKIEKLENYQDIEEEARDVHAVLVAKEKQKLEQQQQERKQELTRKAALEQQQQQAVIRIVSEKVKAREFDGIPLDEKTAKSLTSYILEKKWQLGENQISDFEKEVLDLSRPENRDAQVKVALLMYLLKTDPALGILQKKAVTKQTDKIFSFLQREESTEKKQGRKRSNFFDD